MIEEEDDEYVLSEAFEKKISGHGVSLEEVKELLERPDAKWVQNRGDATSGVTGFSSTGRCIYIPMGTHDDGRLKPITAYVIEQPRVLLDDNDLRREQWARRKAKRDRR